MAVSLAMGEQYLSTNSGQVLITGLRIRPTGPTTLYLTTRNGNFAK